MFYIRLALSLGKVEDLLHERGIDVCHETVRFWWNRFGPMLAAEIRRWQSERMRSARCITSGGRAVTKGHRQTKPV